MANEKLKWEKPELVYLSNKKASHGDCFIGSSNIDGVKCLTGPSATRGCGVGNTAARYCDVGSADVLPLP